MAGITHGTGIVIGQRLVPPGGSEVAWFAPVLDTVADLTGVVITADTLHTTRDHARYVTSRGGHYVFVAKKQLHRLFALLHNLDWAPARACATHDSGHGRTEHRTIQVLPAPEDINFPAAAQVFRITRQRAPITAAANVRPTPGSALPICPHTTPHPPRSPPCSAATGTSKTGCTGSATSPTAKTTPASAPPPHPAPWPPCAT